MSVTEVETSLNKNQVLSESNRIVILSVIKDYANFFSRYNIDIDIENISKLLLTLDIKESNFITSASMYDSVSNCILISNNPNIKSDVLERDLEKSILSLVTTVYNSNINRYNEGLNFEINGINYGHIVNEKVKDRIVELVYGNIESKVITLPTMEDRLSSDFQQLVGSENLLSYLVNGRGDLLCSDILDICESQTELIEFFTNLNEYEKTDKNYIPDVRAKEDKYKKQMDKLLERKLEEKLVI